MQVQKYRQRENKAEIGSRGTVVVAPRFFPLKYNLQPVVRKSMRSARLYEQEAICVLYTSRMYRYDGHVLGAKACTDSQPWICEDDETRACSGLHVELANSGIHVGS